jgi:hypothetical protein
MRTSLSIILAALLGVCVFNVSGAQSADPVSISPDIVNACTIDQAGVFIQNSKLMPLVNQFPDKTKSTRGFAASLSYGLVPMKIVAEYRGEQAPVRSDSQQPTLWICHMFSLPGEPVLIRLHPKKGMRILDGGRMTVYPIVGGSKMAEANNSDIIPTDTANPVEHVWRIHAGVPLEPGEYALMLGKENMSVFPFSVHPPTVPAVSAK